MVEDRCSRVKLLVMDVDGTLTDGKIYMSPYGELIKVFNIKDGYAIHNILPKNDVIPIVITGRQSQILQIRCAELNINEVYQNVMDKVSKLQDILSLKQLVFSNVAYIGDDLNDISCMRAIKNGGGIVGCPADAADGVKKLSDFISSKNGGDGAVREFVEWLVQ